MVRRVGTSRPRPPPTPSSLGRRMPVTIALVSPSYLTSLLPILSTESAWATPSGAASAATHRSRFRLQAPRDCIELLLGDADLEVQSRPIFERRGGAALLEADDLDRNPAALVHREGVARAHGELVLAQVLEDSVPVAAVDGEDRQGVAARG